MQDKTRSSGRKKLPTDQMQNNFEKKACPTFAQRLEAKYVAAKMVIFQAMFLKMNY